MENLYSSILFDMSPTEIYEKTMHSNKTIKELGNPN